MLLMLAAALAADPVPAIASEVFVARPLPGRTVVDVRGGVHADGNAMICAEASPLVFVALDACGTGSGWLHPRLTTEMRHDRVEANVPFFRAGRFEALAQPGLGMAEVQRDGDAPGLSFERVAGPQQTEAAGPEATLSVRGRGWLSPLGLCVGRGQRGGRAHPGGAGRGGDAVEPRALGGADAGVGALTPPIRVAPTDPRRSSGDSRSSTSTSGSASPPR